MEYYIGNISCDADFLSHHGILGMKWGIRRFQNSDGSLTEEGRRRRGQNGEAYQRLNGEKVRISYKGNKKIYEKSNGVEYVKATDKEAEDFEKAEREYMDRVIKSGSATEAMAYQGELSSSQIREIVERLKQETSLAELAQKEAPVIKTGKEKVEDLLKLLDTLNNVATKVTTYNKTINNVKKMFSGDDTKENDRKAKVNEIISRGNLSEIIKNLDIMTTSEVESAKKRLGLVKEINEMNQPKKKKK